MGRPTLPKRMGKRAERVVALLLTARDVLLPGSSPRDILTGQTSKRNAVPPAGTSALIAHRQNWLVGIQRA